MAGNKKAKCRACLEELVPANVPAINLRAGIEEVPVVNKEWAVGTIEEGKRHVKFCQAVCKPPWLELKHCAGVRKVQAQ